MRISTQAPIDLDRVLGPEKGAFGLHYVPLQCSGSAKTKDKKIKIKYNETNRNNMFFGPEKSGLHTALVQWTSQVVQ